MNLQVVLTLEELRNIQGEMKNIKRILRLHAPMTEWKSLKGSVENLEKALYKYG